MKIVFESATLVTSKGKKLGDLFVADGKIAEPFERDQADRVIDCDGKFLIPGAIDCHVHFREPGAEQKEDWEHGSRAAVMGGVTTVLDMPNNSPAVTSQETLNQKAELIRGRTYVNYGLYVAATGENFEELARIHGAVGVKVYMGSSTGNLLLDSEEMLEKVFRIAKANNLVVVVHAENEARIRERMKEFEGQLSAKTHAEIRDCQCALIAVEEAVKLQQKVANKLHIAHMSCGEEVEVFKKNANRNLSCEVCPHHLYFSMDDMRDSFLKMNPPLRHAEDLRALWEALRDGTISCLATDHAPHTIEEKTSDIASAPAGVPGVEFLLPLMLNEVNENMLTFERVVELTSEAPAKIFGLNGKGSLEIGADADLVLVDLGVEKRIDREMIQSKCEWSPYEGYKLKGWPLMTIVNGEIVMENREIVGEKAGKEISL